MPVGADSINFSTILIENIMAKFIRYLKLRFPFLPIWIIFFIGILSMSELIISDLKINLNLFVISLVPTLFLFYMRILDEFKDFEFDKKNFPERPLHSGLVTKKELILYGVLTVLLIFTISLNFMSSIGIILLVLSFFYSGLMFKEFFIKDFWEKSALGYLLSHQVVLVMLISSIYLSLVFQNESPRNMTLAESSIIIFHVFLPLMVVEIGRKVKHRVDKTGKVTTDTYAYKWGQRNSIYIIHFLWIIDVFLLTINSYLNIYSVIFALIVVSISLLLSYIKFNSYVNNAEVITFFITILILAVNLL